jgi:hypothetical protein
LYVGADATSAIAAERLQRAMSIAEAGQVDWNVCDVEKTRLSEAEARYVTVLPCLVRWSPEPAQEWIVTRVRFRSLIELLRAAGVVFPRNQLDAFLTQVGESDTRP